MKPDRKTGKWPGAQRWVLGVAVTFGALMSAPSAEAQSAYGCRGLENHATTPAIEGRDGYFFSIRPEMQAHHSMGAASIAGMAELSRALASRGTTLILLPVPTRAQVMTPALPHMAAHLGFDPDHADAVYRDMLAQLDKAGIAVADAAPALRAAARAGQKPMLQTDPRPGAVGVAALAGAVEVATRAHPSLTGAARGSFDLTPVDTAELAAPLRRQWQRACQVALPTAEVEIFALTETEQVIRSSTNGPVSPDSLVVLGSDLTATPELNLAGFISAATGFLARGYGVAGASPYAAMNTYLTSDEFAAAPPRIIVWEWPVSQPLGHHGTQPMAELAAAARGACGAPLTLQDGGITAMLDMGQYDPSETSLFIDLDGAQAHRITATFAGQNDLIRTRSLYRDPAQIRTGRFYLSLAGLAPEDIAEVTVTADAPPGENATLRLCQ